MRSRSRSSSPVKRSGRSRISPDISQYGKINRSTVAYATSLAAELSKRRKILQMKDLKTAKSNVDAAQDAKKSANPAAGTSAMSAIDVDAGDKDVPNSDLPPVNFGDDVKFIALPPTPLKCAKTDQKEEAVEMSDTTDGNGTSNDLKIDVVVTKQDSSLPVEYANDGLVVKNESIQPENQSGAESNTFSQSSSMQVTSQMTSQVTFQVTSQVTSQVVSLTALPMPPVAPDEDYDSFNEDAPIST